MRNGHIPSDVWIALRVGYFEEIYRVRFECIVLTFDGYQEPIDRAVLVSAVERLRPHVREEIVGLARSGQDDDKKPSLRMKPRKRQRLDANVNYLEADILEVAK
jgi:hypothetical protein